ncbi:MAG: hypothetical protein ABSG43_07415 [Solirubrobacteraceae bacterium]
MIGVVVRQGDAAEAAAALELFAERLDVRVDRGTRIDDPRWIAP